MHNTPYYDSLTNLRSEQYSFGNKDFKPPRQTIGRVDKGDIIKYESRGSLAAFIYTSDQYSDAAWNRTIWIALSQDGAKTWQYYFTGLYQMQPIDMKWYSKLPLFRDENTLQIEGVLMRQSTPNFYMWGTSSRESVKDGVVIVLDLKLITRDSDGDNLTDIVEQKFRTNPLRKDTNRNGIRDNLDLNPSNSVSRTEQTAVFEAIINSEFAPIDEQNAKQIEVLPDSLKDIEYAKQWEWQDVVLTAPKKTLAGDSTKTVLIITDDLNIRAIRPKYVRTIVISTDEFQKSLKSIFRTEPELYSITPMFKVDGKSNLYLVESSYGICGATYLIQKKQKGWRFQMIISWIT